MSLNGCRKEMKERIEKMPGYENFEFIFVEQNIVFFKKKHLFVMVTYINPDDIQICYLSSPEVVMLYNHVDDIFKSK